MKSKLHVTDQLSVIYSQQLRSFDVDFPLECDDEYWTNVDPELGFKQPPGKPSTVAMFNCVLRLSRILAQAYISIVKSSFLFVGFFSLTPRR